MSDMEEQPVEPQAATCPQCGAPNYAPEGDQAQHDPTCSMAPVAQIQPEAPTPEQANTVAEDAAANPEPQPEPVPEPEPQPEPPAE